MVSMYEKPSIMGSTGCLLRGARGADTRHHRAPTHVRYGSPLWVRSAAENGTGTRHLQQEETHKRDRTRGWRDSSWVDKDRLHNGGRRTAAQQYLFTFQSDGGHGRSLSTVVL